MTRERLFELHDDLCRRAKKLMERKNADYGETTDALHNFRAARIVGLPEELGVAIRLSDKMARIGTAIRRPLSVADETVEDTVLDAINYLVLLMACLEEKR